MTYSQKWTDACTHPKRRGNHEVYTAPYGVMVCRACGATNAPVAEPVAAPTIDPALAALLRDCRDTISLALKAAEIQAYPGMAWRKRAKEQIEWIDVATGKAGRGRT